MPKLSRVQKIVLPLLRGHGDLQDQMSQLPEFPNTKIGTWVEDIDYRLFPMINIRRVGGFRHPTRPTLLGKPVIEMTAFGVEGLPETEEMYEDALEVLYKAVKRQTQTEHGYLHSIKETFGGTQFSSLFQDSWRIQGLVQLGIRPPRVDLGPVPPEPEAPEPVSHFEFNEGSGQLVTSSVGGYTLFAVSPSWDPGGGINPGSGFGGFVGPSVTSGRWSVSIEVEIPALPLGGTKSLWHFEGVGGLWFNINTNGEPGPWPPDQFGSIGLTPGVVHTITFVCTPLRSVLYVDGELSRAFPFSYTASWQTNYAVLMDSNAPTGSTMYSARFWDVALTADQVADLSLT